MVCASAVDGSLQWNNQLLVQGLVDRANSFTWLALLIEGWTTHSVVKFVIPVTHKFSVMCVEVGPEMKSWSAAFNVHAWSTSLAIEDARNITAGSVAFRYVFIKKHQEY